MSSGRSDSRTWKTWQVALIALLAIQSSDALAQGGRPFWTEKSTYREGDRLYGVGVSAPQKDVATARTEAFENGLNEILNLLQVSNLKGIKVYTQMTYEEQLAQDETLVFRLVWVNKTEVDDLKEDLHRAEVSALKAETKKLKARARDLEPLYESHQKAISQLEQLERDAEVGRKRAAGILDRAKKTADAVEGKIAERSKLTCLLSKGMTRAETLALVGKPDASSSLFDGALVTWHYGRAQEGA